MQRLAIVAAVLAMASCAHQQQPTTGNTPPTAARQPVIDVHLHALAANQFGPPPQPACSGPLFVGWDPRKRLTVQECASSVLSPTTDDDLMRRTLAVLAKYNVVKAVTSGPRLDQWKVASPRQIIAGLAVGAVFGDGFAPTATPIVLRQLLEQKGYQAIAEFAPQYNGLRPSNTQLEPYFAIAEERDVPIGIHLGPGPPGAAYAGAPSYRMELSDPLLLEGTLVKHPKLRLYVSHAGWPMLDHMIGLLYAHPQVYVDVAVIDWYVPRLEFHAYLRRLVQAGFGKRIMFGSDQMLWPEAVGWGIEAIESAAFLTPDQKRDIFYNNAGRFFRLSDPRQSEGR